MMVIKILGGGCPKCQKLYENTLSALRESGTEAEVEKVTDYKEMLVYQVLSTPALVIDEKVVSTGQVLSAETIKTLL